MGSGRDADRLTVLSERTKLPQSQLLRDALELLFASYDRLAKGKVAKS